MPSLNEEECSNLLAPIMMEEVTTAVMGMHSFKAPRPDGFHAYFFKHFWHIVQADVFHLVKIAFSSSTFDPSLAETLLVLIPKVDQPNHLKNFRPISLCNVIYKIVTKVIVNRIHTLLHRIISPLQGSFIPGRGTVDNIILAQEMLHWMHKSKRKKGVVAFKIDLEKAYDRIDWDFLLATLQDFGFPSLTIRLIMHCVTSSCLAILWNGSILESFSPSRGLRQGDPMSPYLFVLCMEKLSVMIQKKVDASLWKPIKLVNNGPGISHLLFADDMMLFCHGKKSQVRCVIDTLNDFCRMSGLRINLDKSQAMASKHLTRRKRESICNFTSIRFTNDFGKYLGVPIIKGRVTRATFNPILEKNWIKVSCMEKVFIE